MDNTTKFFIGIDVSKPHFDVSLMAVINHEKQTVETGRFYNTIPGLKLFDKWLKKYRVSFDENSLLVIENTGIYHRLLWSYCSNKNLPIHIGNAAHIKWSFGIARGKNDIIDSLRLCQYGFKEADTLKATPGLNPVLILLKDLVTSRSKLISQINSIKTYIKELKDINDRATQNLLAESYKDAIKGIAKSIKKIEAEIKKIIAGDPALKTNYDLLISVPGIGRVTAVYMLCCTANFAGKINGKQLACYAGVVPFEYQSGISIKGKSRVHKMANKDLKKLVNMGALSAIRCYPEFRNYYERKTKEGKHPYSVINAIRNKIILRAVAVVNNQKPYVNNYIVAA
jgi:transposase